MSTKLKGDIAEQAAILAALKRDFGVLVPVGDRLAYDLVFESCGQFVRIQVKSAWFDVNKRNWVVDNRRTKTNRRTMLRSNYAEGDFDFALLYIDALNIFYVMPSTVFNAYGSEIHLVEDQKRQRKPASAQYRQAWHLLFPAACTTIRTPTGQPNDHPGGSPD